MDQSVSEFKTASHILLPDAEVSAHEAPRSYRVSFAFGSQTGGKAPCIRDQTSRCHHKVTKKKESKHKLSKRIRISGIKKASHKTLSSKK